MKFTALHSLLLFFVAGSWISASAQVSSKYQPMAVEGAHWICIKIYNKPWGDEYFSWSIRGDTTINRQVYKKMYRDEFFIDINHSLAKQPVVIGTQLTALMRDDTSERKVYGIILPNARLSTPCDTTTEVLLFNFGVKSGDTLQSCSAAPIIETPLIVDSINYTPFNKFCNFNNSLSVRSLRTLNVSAFWDFYLAKSTERISEEIGYQRFGPFFENWSGLNSGLQLEWVIYGGLICHCVGSDADCKIVSSNKEISYRPLKIYPNPVEDRLYFENPADHQFKRLRVYHSSGQMVQQLSAQGIQNSYIDTSRLHLGQYFIQGIDEDGIIFSAKFIKL